MPRDPRHDVLFEPVRIGPLTTRNRFFQVPHCNGMGHRDPTSLAFMRGVKAEGGWSVVCTEEVEIHPSSEVSPYAEGRLWDDADIPALALMVEKVHEHGSLAGIQLCHNGSHGANLYSRLAPMSVGHFPVAGHDPVQARMMGTDDIADLRRRHRAAVRRALAAGFDLVYVYAGHGLNAIGQFLDPRLNQRTDGYGGTLANRARLLREDICECIGCNICVSGDTTITPIRCTQNPTMGEEWRRGWHPERIRPRTSEAKVLVVGAGPAGLEAAQALGKRGYEVVLAEATRSLGGRVEREARLPGLAAWIRVLDYRRSQIDRLPSVEVALESRLTADEILSYDFQHVAIATGARWRDDGAGRWHPRGLPIADGVEVLTPDDLLAGARPRGSRVVLFDDDHYYLGGVLAELLVSESFEVTLVTPAARVSEWSVNTMEQERIQRRLLELGVTVATAQTLVAIEAGTARTACVYTGREADQACDCVVLVTSRLPEDVLFAELTARTDEWGEAGIASVRTVGDAWCPGTIAAAVWDGRRDAEELDEPDPGDGVPFLREIVLLADGGG